LERDGTHLQSNDDGNRNNESVVEETRSGEQQQREEREGDIPNHTVHHPSPFDMLMVDSDSEEEVETAKDGG
jgi:hypothetical protein